MSTHPPPNGQRRVVDFLSLALPNALSAMRLVCAALFPFATPHGRVGLILIAAISDGLDGLLARRLGRTTWWGGFLDAGADKVFAATVIIDLLVRGQLALWQVALLLARDLTVVGIILLGTLTGRWQRIKRASAETLGKLTTAALFALFLVLVGWPQHVAIVWPLMIAAMALSVLAGAHYFVRVVRSLAT